MKKEITTIKIHDRVCHVYKHDSSNAGHMENGMDTCLFYWGTGSDSRDLAAAVVSYLELQLKKQLQDCAFVLAAYESENWNDDFSPWKAQAVFGDSAFGGNAGKTLEWLEKDCIPYIESADSGYIRDADKVLRVTAGYSLAGLFSLWAYSKSTVFKGAVSCSGSLWYEGWLDYVRQNRAAFQKDGTNYIYLSLGNKEERTKNRQMSIVGDNTRAFYGLLNGTAKSILEWNNGGHFSETDMRIAKGIYWILSSNSKE